jgi:hypothetical protein
VIDEDVERSGGATKPSESADPTSPYKVVGNRQRTMLISETNHATQERHPQCQAQQQRLNNLRTWLVKVRSVCVFEPPTIDVTICIVSYGHACRSEGKLKADVSPIHRFCKKEKWRAKRSLTSTPAYTGTVPDMDQDSSTRGSRRLHPSARHWYGWACCVPHRCHDSHSTRRLVA